MKNILLPFLFLITLCACETMTFEDELGKNPSTPQAGKEEKGMKEMCFKCTGFSMDDISEISRASSKQEYTDHLLLGIFDNNGNLVGNIMQHDKNDTTITYGTFNHVLKYGKYTILAIGWNGDQQCIVQGLDNISFSAGWVPHTFLCRRNIVVSEAYSDTRTLSMERCVARFVLKCKDQNLPEESVSFQIRTFNAGNTLDSETRHCTHIQEFVRNTGNLGTITAPLSITSYCFLPEDSANVNINVAAFDKDGNLLAEKYFAEVPMKINYSTNYSGYFFPMGEVEGSVSFNFDFDGDINHEF